MCLDYATKLSPTISRTVIKEFNLTDNGTLIGKYRKTQEFIPETMYHVKFNEIRLKCGEQDKHYNAGFHGYPLDLGTDTYLKTFKSIVALVDFYNIHTAGTQSGLGVFVAGIMKIDRILYIPEFIGLYSFYNGDSSNWISDKIINKKNAEKYLKLKNWIIKHN